MRKMWKLVPAILMSMGLGSLALGSSGCGDGKFAGPPGGSATGQVGVDPLFGATVFTFAPENPAVTGFHDDYWYIDPGRDSDDAASGAAGAWYADTIQALQTAGFNSWIVGGTTPTNIEVNFSHPMMLSFMCQWFRRNADGSRIRERDQFGNLIWSPKSLDISLVTAPVTRQVIPVNQVVYRVDRQVYPANVSPQSVMFGFTSPPANSPGAFPPPQSRYLVNNFSEVGVVLLTKLLPAGSPQLTQARGVSIDDTSGTPTKQGNENVENIGAVPRQQGGGFTTVPTPTGVFGDLYAIDYKNGRVVHPNTPGRTVEEAIIEYVRHFGALHANLISKAIGLISNEGGSITDSKQFILLNGYPYSFVQKDLDTMDKQLLPGSGRDPNIP